MVAEQRDDLFGLVHPHEAMIDEDAGQLVADRFVDEHCSNRRIDPARKTADDLAVTHLFADFRDLGAAKLGHGPVAREPADMAHEIGKQLAAIGRVDHFGVELRAVILALLVGDDREGGAVAGGDDAEAGGEAGDLVAMAHPHLVPLAGLPQPVEQRALFRHGEIGAAEFAAFAGFMPRANLAAELLGHYLLAITNAEDRQAAVEQDLRCARAAFVAYAGGRSRQDDTLGLEPVECLLRLDEGGDLGIHAGLAHAARDELGDLAAEIDDEDGIGEVFCLHGSR